MKQHLFIFTLVLALSSGVGCLTAMSDDDLCGEAADHVADCLGTEAVVSDDCTAEQAETILAQDCGQLIAQAGDMRADGWSYVCDWFPSLCGSAADDGEDPSDDPVDDPSEDPRADGFTLWGEVYNEGNGRMEYVRVEIIAPDGHQVVAFTDDTGSFRLDDAATGDYVITVIERFARYTSHFDVSSSTELPLRIVVPWM